MREVSNHLGKFLLTAGIVLSLLVVVEAHQKMSEARALNALATQNAIRTAPSAVPADRLMPQVDDPSPRDLAPADSTRSIFPRLRRSPQIPATPSTPARTLSPTGTSRTATPGTTPTAISVGEPGAQAQNLSSVDVAQVVARNEWSNVSFPLEQFQAYTSPFGYRRSIEGYNYNEFHYGLDMAAPQGSYIRTWTTGVVVEVTDDSNCGTSVVVEAGRWLSIYCHMEGRVDRTGGRRSMLDRAGGIQIYEGQMVYAGQRVGRVGMTGRTTGPHLHWGLKYDNNWVDPALVLRAMYSGQQTAQGLPQLPTQLARVEAAGE
ncbi:M23 family metallopeptidase [Thermoleptolyngbya sp.]